MRFMLVLTGLPTLFPKLVEARTFAERMFHVMFLDPLNEKETRDAITIPIQKNQCPFSFKEESLNVIWTVTRGYPYFIQYFCREVSDVWIQASESGQEGPNVPVDPIMKKLHSDFLLDVGRGPQIDKENYCRSFLNSKIATLNLLYKRS